MAYFALNGSVTGSTWPMLTVNNQKIFQSGPEPLPRQAGSILIQRVATGQWEQLPIGMPHPDSVMAAPKPPAPAPTQAPAAAPPAQRTEIRYTAGDVGSAQGATYVPVTRKTPEAVKEGGGGLLVALAAAAALFFSGS